jgi:hypothetical protein
MFVIGLKNCTTISPNIPRLIEHKLGHFLTILWAFIFRNEFSIKKKLCTYHESDLLEIPLDFQTRIYKHFALVWTTFQTFKTIFLQVTKFGHCPTCKIFSFYSFRYFYVAFNLILNKTVVWRRTKLFFFGKKRWMPNLRQQKCSSAVWAELTKHFTNSSQKWTINMCK